MMNNNNFLTSTDLQVGKKYPDPRVVKHYIDKIISAYHPERVYVIGSAARGTARETSDIDFVVESNNIIDPDVVIGAVDIIPYRSLSKSMRESFKKEAVLVYERK